MACGTWRKKQLFGRVGGGTWHLSVNPTCSAGAQPHAGHSLLCSPSFATGMGRGPSRASPDRAASGQRGPCKAAPAHLWVTGRASLSVFHTNQLGGWGRGVRGPEGICAKGMWWAGFLAWVFQ